MTKDNTLQNFSILTNQQAFSNQQIQSHQQTLSNQQTQSNHQTLTNQQSQNHQIPDKNLQLYNQFSSNIFPIKEKVGKKHKVENSPNSKRNLKNKNSKNTAKLLVQKSKGIEKSKKEIINKHAHDSNKSPELAIIKASNNTKKHKKKPKEDDHSINNKSRDCKSNMYIKNNIEKDFIQKELNQVDANLSKLGNSISVSNEINSVTSRKFKDEISVKNNSLDINAQRRDNYSVNQKRSPNYIIKRQQNSITVNTNSQDVAYSKNMCNIKDPFLEFEKNFDQIHGKSPDPKTHCKSKDKHILEKSKDKIKQKNIDAIQKNIEAIQKKAVSGINNQPHNPSVFSKDKNKQLVSLSNHNYMFKAVNYWVEFSLNNQEQPERGLHINPAPSLNIKNFNNSNVRRPNYN